MEELITVPAGFNATAAVRLGPKTGSNLLAPGDIFLIHDIDVIRNRDRLMLRRCEDHMLIPVTTLRIVGDPSGRVECFPLRGLSFGIDLSGDEYEIVGRITGIILNNADAYRQDAAQESDPNVTLPNGERLVQ